MVLLTFTIVILRYVFQEGWIGMQEAVGYMHSLVFMLGIAYTLKRDGHVRVDVFYRNFSNKAKAWVNLAGILLLLFPLSFFILWSSWGYVTDAWMIQEASPNPGGLPGVFLLKTSILLMALLLILQGLSEFIRNLYILLDSPLVANNQRSLPHG